LPVSATTENRDFALSKKHIENQFTANNTAITGKKRLHNLTGNNQAPLTDILALNIVTESEWVIKPASSGAKLNTT